MPVTNRFEYISENVSPGGVWIKILSSERSEWKIDEVEFYTSK